MHDQLSGNAVVKQVVRGGNAAFAIYVAEIGRAHV